MWRYPYHSPLYLKAKGHPLRNVALEKMEPLPKQIAEIWKINNCMKYKIGALKLCHTQRRGKEWWMMAYNWQLRCDDVMKTQHATLKWNNLIPLGWAGTHMNVNFNKIYEKRGILPNAITTLFFFFSATEDTNKNGVSFNNEDWSDPANLTSFETFFYFL